MAARVVGTILALCVCFDISLAFVVPTSSMLRLAGVSRGSIGLSTGLQVRKARSACSSLSMKLPSQRDPTSEEIEAQRAYEAELEKRYILENSGLGYRKNSQDSLLAVMGENCIFVFWVLYDNYSCSGASIIILPLIFVGIAIATGYVPLDYLR